VGAEDALDLAKQSSEFDSKVKDGFGKIKAEGSIMRSDPAQMRYRCLDGITGVTVAWSQDHFSQKRKNTRFRQVCIPVNKEAFNFTKINEAEIIGHIDVPGRENEIPMQADIIANVSPLAEMHVLIVPDRARLHPQFMTKDLLLAGLQILSLSTRSDFRLVFNSLAGFASVNHFHYHGMYLTNCGCRCSVLPLESKPRTQVNGDQTESNINVELILESNWHVRCLVFSAVPTPDEEGSDTPGHVQTLASAAARFICNLQKKNVPHNIILAPPLPHRLKKTGCKAQDETPDATSPEVIIVPRQPEDKLREDAGFNAAVMEISGIVYCHSQAEFESFSEEDIKTIFNEDVSYPSQEFDELICEAAWLSSATSASDI